MATYVKIEGFGNEYPQNPQADAVLFIDMAHVKTNLPSGQQQQGTQGTSKVLEASSDDDDIYSPYTLAEVASVETPMKKKQRVSICPTTTRKMAQL